MASTEVRVTPSATLGERLRAARHERGMSQAHLAGNDLTKGFISQVESGLVRPSVKSLQILAARLEKSLDYFLGDEPLAQSKRVTFHRLAAQACLERGDWTSLRTEVALASEYATESRDHARLAALLAGADIATGDMEAALSRISVALTIVEPEADALEIAQLLFWRGNAYAQLGQLTAATEAFEGARSVIERHELADPRLRARLLVSLGTAYRRLNRTTKALATYEAALAAATRGSELELAARGYMGIAATLYDSGEFDPAIANYQRALQLWERLSDSNLELSVMHSLASTFMEQGQVDLARTMAERCLARAESIHQPAESAAARTQLSRVALAEGRIDDALGLATTAEAMLAKLGDDHRRVGALSVLGASSEASGLHAAADAAYGLAIELSTSMGHLADRTSIAIEYSRLLRSRGDLIAALDMLELAYATGAPKPK